jgi:UDP-GlcNAc:undecaprenyl-phosphate GlcNAc-1-phosphate transferase
MLEASALPFITSLAAALLATPIAIRLSPRCGFMDPPRPGRAHSQATPRLGGAALAAAVVLGFGPWWLAVPLPVLGGALLAVASGFVDDRRHLKPPAKLAAQAAASALIVMPGAAGHHGWAVALAVFWGVSVQNAANLLDNQDGALTSAAIPAALGLGAMGLLARAPAVAAASFALAGALAGFLHYNRPRAAIFLGDHGSQAVGFALAALTLALAHKAGSAPRALAPAIAVAYPLFDLVFITATRIAGGRKVHEGGTDHTTHRLAAALGSVGRADIAIAAISTAVAVTAAARYANPSWGGLAVAAGAGIAFFAWLGARLAREGIPPLSPP